MEQSSSILFINMDSPNSPALISPPASGGVRGMIPEHTIQDSGVMTVPSIKASELPGIPEPQLIVGSFEPDRMVSPNPPPRAVSEYGHHSSEPSAARLEKVDVSEHQVLSQDQAALQKHYTRSHTLEPAVERYREPTPPSIGDIAPRIVPARTGPRGVGFDTRADLFDYETMKAPTQNAGARVVVAPNPQRTAADTVRRTPRSATPHRAALPSVSVSSCAATTGSSTGSVSVAMSVTGINPVRVESHVPTPQPPASQASRAFAASGAEVTLSARGAKSELDVMSMAARELSVKRDRPRTIVPAPPASATPAVSDIIVKANQSLAANMQTLARGMSVATGQSVPPRSSSGLRMQQVPVQQLPVPQLPQHVPQHVQQVQLPVPQHSRPSGGLQFKPVQVQPVQEAVQLPQPVPQQAPVQYVQLPQPVPQQAPVQYVQQVQVPVQQVQVPQSHSGGLRIKPVTVVNAVPSAASQHVAYSPGDILRPVVTEPDSTTATVQMTHGLRISPMEVETPYSMSSDSPQNTLIMQSNINSVTVQTAQMSLHGLNATPASTSGAMLHMQQLALPPVSAASQYLRVERPVVVDSLSAVLSDMGM